MIFSKSSIRATGGQPWPPAFLRGTTRGSWPGGSANNSPIQKTLQKSAAAGEPVFTLPQTAAPAELTTPRLQVSAAEAAQGRPDCVVRVIGEYGGLVLYWPGQSEPNVLYAPPV